MNACIFIGPTISPAEALVELEAIYLPPAAEGDVYRAALKRPQAIGIIDGYFQSVAAVRHKEILWAMSQGIHVFGSASIGALRAAELGAFGMQGVGRIFGWYRDGELEDDDEVAIAHAPESSGFRAASEAMVNIRATLSSAAQSGVVSSETRTLLENTAKNLFYPDRHYPTIFKFASVNGIAATELAGFQQWLPTGRVNQKRTDALSMLRCMRESLTNGLAPQKVAYSFQHTLMWETARQRAAGAKSSPGT